MSELVVGKAWSSSDRFVPGRSLSTGARIYWSMDNRALLLPISNLPEGTIRYRVRLRVKEAAQCFVKTGDGISRWIMGEDGNSASKLLFKTAQNSKWKAKHEKP